MPAMFGRWQVLMFGRWQVLQNLALFPKTSKLSEPTKKAMRGMRPRMAFVSLAVFTGGN